MIYQKIKKYFMHIQKYEKPQNVLVQRKNCIEEIVQLTGNDFYFKFNCYP